MNKNYKVAIVTGGSSGIGLASVKALSTEGYKVYVLDVQKFPENDSSTNYIQCDVSVFKNVSKAIDEILTLENKIDVLFANAGIHFYGNIEETSPDDLEKILSVNLKGIFNVVKCVLPVMKMQKNGSIILMGSDQSLIGKSSSTGYGVTKGAVAQLAKSTAIDYGPYNVRVNCVCPGAIDTPLYQRAIEVYAKNYAHISKGELEKAVLLKYPLRRIGTPEEVANLVAFLASDKASFITGSVISIDGGYSAQ